MTTPLKLLVLTVGLAACLTACHRGLPVAAPAGPSAPVSSAAPNVGPSSHTPTAGSGPTASAPAGPTQAQKDLLDQLAGQASHAADSTNTDLDAASPGDEPDPTS